MKTPLTHSDGVRVTPVAKSSNNQTNNQTEYAFLPVGSHFKTQQDVNPDGGELDPSTQIQTDTNVKEVTNTCSIENTSQTERERVIRKLSITSTSFIGPVCRPEPSIEQELCDFYKELEEVDKVDVNADTKTGWTAWPSSFQQAQKRSSKQYRHSCCRNWSRQSLQTLPRSTRTQPKRSKKMETSLTM